MATSGEYSHQLTRNDLISAVMRKLAALSEGQTPSTQNYTDIQQSLNNNIAAFRTLGMPLWARESFTFTPTTGQYNIGEGQTLNTVFPVKVIQAYRTDTNTKVELDLIPREEYNILPSGSAGSGSFVKLSYQPYINYGTIWLWPSPSSTNTSTCTIVYQRPLQYFTGSTETLDMPEEWYNALIYTTAVDVSPEWSVPLQDRQWLEKQATKYLDIAAGVGQDMGSFYIQPERVR